MQRGGAHKCEDAVEYSAQLLGDVVSDVEVQRRVVEYILLKALNKKPLIAQSIEPSGRVRTRTMSTQRRPCRSPHRVRAIFSAAPGRPWTFSPWAKNGSIVSKFEKQQKCQLGNFEGGDARARRIAMLAAVFFGENVFLEWYAT